MKTIRFGIIGAGLMGREFASASARWCHLPRMDVRPDVDAVYCAVPHNLHREVFSAAIESGKHLMGEKPFGIDLAANEAILAAARAHPDVFVRCCSQFPFFPAVQEIGRRVEDGQIGEVIEVETGFLHSSDLNPNKPINWKRRIESNGAYGVLGDLGMHACHVPFRAGWRPRNVRAILSNLVPQRPDRSGALVPCETWDNGTLLCEMEDPASGRTFPWTFKAFRISPGQKNTWYVNILGTRTSVRWSTRNPKRLDVLEYDGGEQVWGQVELGAQTAFETITAGIFETGFSDAVQQMWAAYLHELVHGSPPSRFAGCVRPDEAHLSHQLFTAALESHRTGATVPVPAADTRRGRCG